MFRSAKLWKAALVSFKPSLVSSVNEEAKVRQMIGIRISRLSDIQTVNSIVEKTQGKGLAAIAAKIGRAAIYLNARNPIACIEEITEVFPEIEDETLKQMAVGTSLRAWNDLLDDKEAVLSVSGAVTEVEISEIRTKALESYKAFKALYPNSWLVRLVCAEFNMYMGKVQDAYKEFVEIEKDIQKAIDTPPKLVNEVATDKNTNPFLLLGHQLLRYPTLRNIKWKANCKQIPEAILNLHKAALEEPGLKTLKKDLGVDLSDEEAIEIALILYNANLRHHFHDFFPIESEYEDWESDKARRAKKLMQSAYHGVDGDALSRILDKVRSSVHQNASDTSLEKLKDVLKKAPKDRNAVHVIREALATEPNTPVSESDQACLNAMSFINDAGIPSEGAGTLRYAQHQAVILSVLHTQLLYRTKIQIAVALTEMNRLHEAVETVTPVIDANEYIFMWRALLTRSRAYKGLGLITLSDNDTKALNKLKRSIVGRSHDEASE